MFGNDKMEPDLTNNDSVERAELLSGEWPLSDEHNNGNDRITDLEMMPGKLFVILFLVLHYCYQGCLRTCKSFTLLEQIMGTPAISLPEIPTPRSVHFQKNEREDLLNRFFHLNRFNMANLVGVGLFSIFFSK